MRIWQTLLIVFFVESILSGIPTWIFTHDIVFASLEVAVVFTLSITFIVGYIISDNGWNYEYKKN